jgi:hypothetical protein
MLFGASTLEELRVLTFSPLSATIINTYVRGDFDNDACPASSYALCSPPQVQTFPSDTVPVTVSVIDQTTRTGINGCSVKAWYVNSMIGDHPPEYPERFAHRLIAEGGTNGTGAFTFPWGADPFTGNETMLIRSNIARLVKVSCSGYEPNGDWISAFDLQAGLMMPNGGQDNDFRYPGKMIIEMKRL